MHLSKQKVTSSLFDVNFKIQAANNFMTVDHLNVDSESSLNWFQKYHFIIQIICESYLYLVHSKKDTTNEDII